MSHLWNFYWLLSSVLSGQISVQSAVETWPTSYISKIRVLGLFPVKPNASRSEETTLSIHSRAMFQAAMVLGQQYNITIQGQFISWQATQTSGDIISALSNTCRAMSNSNIIGIVGPAFSREAQVIAPFAASVGIPAISYSATDPELFNRNTYRSFYRTVPSDNYVALPIVKLFTQFNWTSCIIIYQNDAFGTGGAGVISEAFNDNNLVVSESLHFDISTLSFERDLKFTFASVSSRIVIVWADAICTLSILQQAIDNNVVGPHFLWILSSSIDLNSFNQTSYSQLIGMISLEPVVGNVVNVSVNTTLLNAAFDIWQKYEPETFPGSAQVDSYGFFAFDATWSLIQSLQRLCLPDTVNSTTCLSFVETPFCFDRYFQNESSLLNTISAIEFLGVSGPVQFSANVTDRINGTYYVVKNVQPSRTSLAFVSMLDWYNSNEWTSINEGTTILWPGSSALPPTGLADLAGVQLRIGVMRSSPFVMATNEVGMNSTNVTGFALDVISGLQARMGFIPEIILAPSNATYGGMVRAVADGIYDIVVGDITVTSARREFIDFSAAIFDNSLRVIVRQANTNSIDLFSYLKPFSLSLWLALFVALIYAAILMCLFERHENDALKDRSFASTASLSVWYSFNALIAYGGDFPAKTVAGRVLTGGVYILSLVVVATYTANLASNLTLSKSQTVISGVDDIKNGKIPFSRVGIIVDSSIEDYYLQEISNNVKNFYPLTDETDLYNSLLNKDINAAIMDGGVLEYSTNKIYCNLTLVGADFAASSFAIVVPKQWVYLRALDVNILSLRELGILDNLKSKWFDGRTCADSVTSDSSLSIDIFEISGLFMTFASITVFAILLFIWDKRFSIKDYIFFSRVDPSQHSGSRTFNDRL